MIPVAVFGLLIGVAIFLLVYAFVDNRNKYYGNIIAAFLASLLFIYLGVMISIGVVQYDPSSTFTGVNITNVSECLRFDNQTQDCLEYLNTTITHNICNACPGIPVVDVSLGYMLLLFGVVMMIYTLFMVYEVYDERRLEKEEGS